MKQAILHFDKGDVMLVEADKDLLKLISKSELCTIGGHRCKYIGKLSELTEDKCSSIVDGEPSHYEYYKLFRGHLQNYTDSAAESFLSKMEAEGIKLTFIKEFYYDEDPALFHSDHTFIFKILKS